MEVPGLATATHERIVHGETATEEQMPLGEAFSHTELIDELGALFLIDNRE